MAILLFICLALICSWLCFRLARCCERWSKELKHRREQDQYWKEALAKSVDDVRRAVTPEEPERPSTTEGLLQAHQEIQEARKVREAIKKELGVE